VALPEAGHSVKLKLVGNCSPPTPFQTSKAVHDSPTLTVKRIVEKQTKQIKRIRTSSEIGNDRVIGAVRRSKVEIPAVTSLKHRQIEACNVRSKSVILRGRAQLGAGNIVEVVVVGILQYFDESTKENL
jgi:hypothetical protein